MSSSTIIIEEEDRNDLYLAHQYRLSLSTKPKQSNFRVVALLFYTMLEDEHDETPTNNNNNNNKFGLPPWLPQTTMDGSSRSYIVGTNDEPGYMGGAICAERAAMVQFRFLHQQPYEITKVVIATDHPTEPISPGMLCREFLAGHVSVPWNVSILSSASICPTCGGCPTGGDDNDNGDASSSPSSSYCCCSHEALPILKTTLESLYPFPSPYTRLNVTQSVALGEWYQSQYPLNINDNGLEDSPLWHTQKFENDKNVMMQVQQLLKMAVKEAQDTVNDVHDIQFGAAVLLENNNNDDDDDDDDTTIILTSHQCSALEYGCTLDAVSQLANRLFAQKRSSIKYLVQADQYGMVHPPFAPARAFLTEEPHASTILSLEPSSKVLVYDNDTTVVTAESMLTQPWRLGLVPIRALAPNAPSWTDMKKQKQKEENLKN